MSAEALSPDRIEGEFYYARKVQGDVVFESWMIFHRGDDEEASDYYWRGRDAHHIVEALDAAARHFITTERNRILELIEGEMAKNREKIPAWTDDPGSHEATRLVTRNYALDALAATIRKETETND